MKTSEKVLKRIVKFLLKFPVVGKKGFLKYQRHKFNKQKNRYKKIINSYQNMSYGYKDPEESLSMGHEITLKCNLECSMCYQKSFRDKYSDERENTTREILKIYDSLSIKHIDLIGSEIFMRKDIMEIIGHLDKRNIGVHIVTNGTLLNQEKIDILKGFKNIRHIGFSIDGPKEIHNAIRGMDKAFDLAVSNIVKCKDDFRVGINSVITDQNIDALTDIIDIVSGLGLYSLNFTFEEFVGKKDMDETKDILNKEFGWGLDDFELNMGTKGSLSFTYDILRNRVDSLIAYSLKKGIRIRLQPSVWFFNMEEYYTGSARKGLRLICPKVMNKSMRVDHKGNVYHCGAIRKSFGNLLEASAEDIWNSEEYINFRTKLHWINLLPICKRCCKVSTI